MKKKTNTQKKLLKIEKEDFKNISTTKFDSVMKKILSAPPEIKKKKSK